MGWGQALRALKRRWYVLVLGLLATAGLLYVAWDLTPPTYIARGTELLLPPTQQVDEGTQNALLELSGLDAPASLVIGQLDSQAVHDQVAEFSPEAEYTVETDPSLRGPTVLVTMNDATPEQVLASLAYVLDLVPRTLSTMQANLDVPTTATVTSMRLTADTEPEVEYSATVRLLVLVAGVGAVGTVVLAVALDALFGRDRRRKPMGSDKPGKAKANRRSPARAEAVTPEHVALSTSRDNSPCDNDSPSNAPEFVSSPR